MKLIREKFTGETLEEMPGLHLLNYIHKEFFEEFQETYVEKFCRLFLKEIKYTKIKKEPNSGVYGSKFVEKYREGTPEKSRFPRRIFRIIPCKIFRGLLERFSERKFEKIEKILKQLVFKKIKNGRNSGWNSSIVSRKGTGRNPWKDSR